MQLNVLFFAQARERAGAASATLTIPDGSCVRDALKAKGLLGPNDTTVQVLDKLDLTNAQKRDERFYPDEAVVIFNQKIREAEPGAKGKLAGIVKSGVLVEVGGRFVTVSNEAQEHRKRFLRPALS